MRRSGKKQILNGVAEFIIIIAMYWISGIIRVFLPFGMPYSMTDTYEFFPVGIIYAAVIVLFYFFSDSYSRIHFSGWAKEAVKLVLINLVGFGFMSGFMFIFRMSQFSRIMLVIFYALTVFSILVKRKLLTKMEMKKYAGRKRTTQMLIIGSGRAAEVVVRESEENADNKTKDCIAGYLADKRNAAIDSFAERVLSIDLYLGNLERLKDILNEKQINKIIIAMDLLPKEVIDYVMAVTGNRNIEVGIVPVYSDYINTVSAPQMLGSMNVLAMTSVSTCQIMGVDIAVADMNRTLRLIEERLGEWKGRYICASNVHTTVMAYENEEYRRVQNGAVMALPDGGPLSEYSRAMGFDEARRVTGPDVMHRILAMSPSKGWRHYFYGSTDETLEKMKAQITEFAPEIAIAGMYSPPFRELTDAEDTQIINMINDAKPDFVWVGLGAPKQEIWMAAHEGKIQALMVGVGAAFDYEAGNIARAPKWMQDHSLEWLYRLMQDPVRLLKRYIITNSKYLWWKLWQ